MHSSLRPSPRVKARDPSMPIVLITGASGRLGRALLDPATASRYGQRALSRRDTVDDGSPIEWFEGDLATGEGIEAAVGGVDTIIHAASSSRQNTHRIDVDGTVTLTAAAARAGVRHIVFISIVGVDRIPFPYYQHKLAAERAVQASGVPWTICRGTQFHDFMDFRLHSMIRGPFALVPRGYRGQPIDVSEFAEVVWRIVDGGPTHEIVEAAGPQVLTYREMMEDFLRARGMRRLVIERPASGAVGDAWRRGDATAPSHAIGRTTWRAWLARKYPALPSA